MKRLTLKYLAALVTVAAVAFAIQTPAHAEEVVASGKFKGKSSHVTKGTVNIVKTESGYLVKLASNFSLDGAPDPTLAFGKSGAQPDIIAKLKSNRGAQTYEVPADINVSDYDQFYIWCEQYSVPLGLAKLK